MHTPILFLGKAISFSHCKDRHGSSSVASHKSESFFFCDWEKEKEGERTESKRMGPDRRERRLGENKMIFPSRSLQLVVGADK